MLKKNRWKLMISSGLILLPALFGVIFWNRLPELMMTHWGADGIGDGFSQKAVAVFGLPLLLLAFHLGCLLITARDNPKQDQKAFGMVFWILPVISFFTNGILYSAAFGRELDFTLFLPAIFGAGFLLVGNYLPKTRQNRTLGIKLFWTLHNEENWNKTHRFAGKLWVAGGLLMILAALLPFAAMLWVVVAITVAMVILPVAYSYAVFRQHQKEGIPYTAAPQSSVEKNARKFSAVFVPVVLVGCIILMFTGNVAVSCGEEALKVSATYYTDLEIDYSKIETVTYREDFDMGMRSSGFGTPVLSLGIFRNEEFGAYTLYSYTDAEAHVVLTSGGKILVIGLRDAGQTRAIYEALTEKIGS